MEMLAQGIEQQIDPGPAVGRDLNPSDSSFGVPLQVRFGVGWLIDLVKNLDLRYVIRPDLRQHFPDVPDAAGAASDPRLRTAGRLHRQRTGAAG